MKLCSRRRRLQIFLRLGIKFWAFLGIACGSQGFTGNLLMTALTTQKYLKFWAFLGIACRNQVFVGNPLMTLLTTLKIGPKLLF